MCEFTNFSADESFLDFAIFLMKSFRHSFVLDTWSLKKIGGFQLLLWRKGN